MESNSNEAINGPEGLWKTIQRFLKAIRKHFTSLSRNLLKAMKRTCKRPCKDHLEGLEAPNPPSLSVPSPSPLESYKAASMSTRLLSLFQGRCPRISSFPLCIHIFSRGVRFGAASFDLPRLDYWESRCVANCFVSFCSAPTESFHPPGCLPDRVFAMTLVHVVLLVQTSIAQFLALFCSVRRMLVSITFSNRTKSNRTIGPLQIEEINKSLRQHKDRWFYVWAQATGRAQTWDYWEAAPAPEHLPWHESGRSVRSPLQGSFENFMLWKLQAGMKFPGF